MLGFELTGVDEGAVGVNVEVTAERFADVLTMFILFARLDSLTVAAAATAARLAA